MKEYYTVVRQEAIVIPEANIRDLGYTVLPWIPIYETYEAAMGACKMLHEERFPLGWVVIRMDQLFESLRVDNEISDPT